MGYPKIALLIMQKKHNKSLGRKYFIRWEIKFYIKAASLKPHAPGWSPPYVRKRVPALLLNLKCVKVKTGKCKTR
jgi:hypothetical protein